MDIVHKTIITRDGMEEVPQVKLVVTLYVWRNQNATLTLLWQEQLAIDIRWKIVSLVVTRVMSLIKRLANLIENTVKPV